MIHDLRNLFEMLGTVGDVKYRDRLRAFSISSEQ